MTFRDRVMMDYLNLQVLDDAIFEVLFRVRFLFSPFYQTNVYSKNNHKNIFMKKKIKVFLDWSLPYFIRSRARFIKNWSYFFVVPKKTLQNMISEKQENLSLLPKFYNLLLIATKGSIRDRWLIVIRSTESSYNTELPDNHNVLTKLGAITKCCSLGTELRTP